VGRPEPARAPDPGREDGGLGSRRRRARVSDLDDLRRRSGVAPQPRPRRPVRTAAHRTHLPVGPDGAAEQDRSDRRHVDDRETRRIRRPGWHHPGRPPARRQLPDHRAQMVHLRTDVRHLPRPRAGTERPVLLLRAPGPARRCPQHLPAAATQGQARQPLQREQRSGIRQHPRLARRRRRPRRAHHRRDGEHDPPGLHARLGDRHAGGHFAGRAPRRAPQRVRRHTGRSTADAQRPRRPGRRGGGLHHRRNVARRADRPGRVRRHAGRAAAADLARGQQVLRVQTRTGPRRRSPGMSGRQRLHRGLTDAAALPRGPADVGVGRFWQRGRPRHPAGDGQTTRVAAGVLRRTRPSGRRRHPARCRGGLAEERVHRRRHHPIPRSPHRRRHGPRPARITAGPARTPGSRRRLPCHQAHRRLGQRLRHPAPGIDVAAIIERSSPKVSS